MFTVCPKCSLTLVVTAADLRVAQGYVRCGRCSNVFNALTALSDGPQSPPEHIAAAAPASRSESPAEAPAQIGEAEVPADSLEFDPASTSVEEVFVALQPGDKDATGTFEAIVLEGDAADADAGTEPLETEAAADPDTQLQQELQSLAERIDAQNRPAAQDFSPGAQSIAASAAETLKELGAGIGGEPRYENEDESRAPGWARAAGVAALIALLVAQAVHHYRHDLAVVPQLSRALGAIYDVLGVSLEPRWDVNAYDVRQLGAMSDPAAPDRLIVRASVKNGAPHAQPLPLLRVAVQDRFGNRIATSDVAPAAYVPRATSPQARLASGQRIDIEMRFVDPGTEAVGFEIDACLAAPGGGVNCANR